MAKLTKIALGGVLIPLLVVAVLVLVDDPAPVSAYPADDVDERLDVLNQMHKLSRLTWGVRYDALRADGDLNWVDWSQDGCSAPNLSFFTDHWNGVFALGCLRHDMTWRTLAFIDGDDGGDGRVWNERNRWIADEQFEEDNEDSCDYYHPLLELGTSLLKCDTWEGVYYTAIRGLSGYNINLSDAEEDSVDDDDEFIEYPARGRVNCRPTLSRCLPMVYMTLDDKPFAPQNIPYIKTGKEVELEVVRAHLQYKRGAPTTSGLGTRKPYGEWRNNGELTMEVEWPVRASTTEGGVSCTSADRTDQTLYLDSETYRPTHNRWDEEARDTTVYIKVCADLDEDDADEELVRFYPRQTRYQYKTRNSYKAHDQDGGQVRHYQNIVADECHAIKVEPPVEIRGSLLETDCLSTRTHGGYADYFQFYVGKWQDVWVDMWRDGGDYLNPYLYVLEGTSLSGREVDHDDDSHGSTYRGAHIARTLARGTYTVVATNSGEGRLRTGDYRLQIREEGQCISNPFLLSNEIEGEWDRHDCEAKQRAYAYADYYTFHVVGNNDDRVTIDLDSDIRAYMYLIDGDDPSSTSYLDLDSGGGRGREDARIKETLDPGEYTIAVVTYYRWGEGDYTLEISGLDR